MNITYKSELITNKLHPLTNSKLMTHHQSARFSGSITFRKIVFILLVIFTCPLTVMSQINFSVPGTGNWNNPAMWSLGHIPLSGESVTIVNGSTISINVNTALIADLVVNVGGELISLNIPSSTLSIEGNVTVNGTLTNNGKIDLYTSGVAFNMGPGSTYTHNPRANVWIDENIFENGIENFHPTSNLIMLKWNLLAMPLGDPTRVTGDFGNVTLSVPGNWDQDGRFATSRIRGDLTITDGNIIMDDGTLGSNTLALNDVVVTGTGSIIFQKGTNRSLTLTCASFTDNSTSTLVSKIMEQSYGTLTWNVTGDLALNHKFFVIEGILSEAAGANINVGGNFFISGDSISILRQVSGALNLNVTGTTSISGNPSYVRFMEGNSGIMNFTTQNFNIGGGTNNILVGGNSLIPSPTAGVFVNILTDLNVTGNSNTTIVNSDINIQRTQILIGRNFTTSVSAALFTAANTNGNLLFDVGGDFTLNSGNFIGQNYAGNIKADSIMIDGNFLFNSATPTNYFYGNRGAASTGGTVMHVGGNFTINNSGTASGQGFNGVYQSNSALKLNVSGDLSITQGRFNGIFNGDGNADITVGGTLNQTNGYFYGIHNLVSTQSGLANFTAGAVNFDRGQFSVYYANSLIATTNTFTVTNNVDINFFAVTDTFSINGVEIIDFSNEARLSMNIGGSLLISGAAGTFVSSKAKGREVVTISGNVTYTGGVTSFNSSVLFNAGNGHPVIMTIGGNVAVSTGTHYFSARSDSLVCNIAGNVSITGGSLSLKGGSGDVLVNVNGGYQQTAGAFHLHNSTITPNLYATTVTINADGDASGDFNQSGGTFSFDNNLSSSSIAPIVYIKSPNYSIGPAGSMSKAANTKYGWLIFSRAGTTLFSRGNGHTLSEIKQKIVSGATLDVVSGNLQITSCTTTADASDCLMMDNGSVLDLRGNKVFSNNQNGFSSILVLLARVRTQHANGLFNNTNNAAFDASGNLDYYLLPTSVVEYYGVDNQIVTGWNLGIATKSQHQYGILEINFQGTPNTEWVYPTSFPTVTSVYIRTQLLLTNGEFNLDDDHIPTAGGKNIYIRSSNLAPIVRTNGYIRSETNGVNGNVIIRFTGATSPSVTIPFAIDNNVANYIPFTMAATAGKIDSLVVGTFATNVANIPLPPGVFHVNNLGGTDNSNQTVDRFWYINTSGTVSAANISYKCTANEAIGISNPRSQKWVPLSLGWALPVGTQSNLVTGTQANGQSSLNGWWTLSALLNPLPVELVSFEAKCVDKQMNLHWTTASETNNELFTVERSADGFEFLPIANIKGAINSTNFINYSIKDLNPLNGINYYRLKQTDSDGEFEYSEIISQQSCKSISGVKFFTYVERGENINLVLEVENAEVGSVTVTDLSGRLIYQVPVNTNKGFNQFVIPASGFSKGVYLLNFKGSVNNFSDKVMLQ
ncbi:MAG: T9SS type A sorting domain-containing protein [Bacteroidetes bacterium]|nr:T9SS type A sorting domain-containing protein [Bacteroidota bacterium]